MILTKPTPWGEISGKLSLTPEQAKRMFDFNMSPYAKGVVLYKSKGKQIIRNLVGCTNKPVGAKKRRLRIFKRLAKIWGKQLNELVYTAWNTMQRKPWCTPYNMFIATNIKIQCNIKRDDKRRWKKLVITQGPIQTPKIHARFYTKNKELNVYIKRIRQEYQIEAVVLDTHDFKVYHIQNCEQQIDEDKGWVWIQTKLTNVVSPVVFVYFRDGDKFSNSTSTIPTNVTKLMDNAITTVEKREDGQSAIKLNNSINSING